MIDFYNYSSNKKIEQDNNSRNLPFLTGKVDGRISGICRICKEDINSQTSIFRCSNCGAPVDWFYKDKYNRD